MSLSKQVKTALDETRLLMLGAQVLFGFKLNSVFQEEFANLSLASRYVDCVGQVLMATAIGLLIAPSMQHRIVENGEDTVRIHRVTGVFAGMALLPFAVSLGLGFYIVFDHVFGATAAFVAGMRAPRSFPAPAFNARKWAARTGTIFAALRYPTGGILVSPPKAPKSLPAPGNGPIRESPWGLSLRCDFQDVR